MNGAEKLSNFGKNYYLKHLHLIRDFCFRCIEALTRKDFNLANFYQCRAKRIVKGINPFSKYLTAEDRQFLLDVKQQLEATFERVASAHAKSETVALNNSIEEIIVETLDLEKDVLGVSLAQLSHKLLVGNSNYVGNTRVAKIQ